ncbi:MAG: ATP synthase subunit I, partial [FCB group bacterium]|nr:ATP synthase subunit I [FCB group bacterium]
MDPQHDDSTTPRPATVPRRLQRRWILAGIVATCSAVIVAGLFDLAAAMGIALGGVAGTLAFWLLARQTAGMMGLSPTLVGAHIYRGLFVRLVLYGLTLTLAYFLDTGDMHVFAGAAG